MNPQPHLKQAPLSKAKQPSALSYGPILPVLRKPAMQTEITSPACPDESIFMFYFSIGDCREVKRWLARQEKQEK